MKFRLDSKTVFVLFLLIHISTITSCTTDQKTAVKKSAFSVIASFGGSYIKDTAEIVFIVGKLYNASPDTISFLSMNCSWDEFWELSTPDLQIQKNPCYLNGTILIQLAPNESMLDYLPVRLLKPYDEIRDEKFSVGYNLVEADPEDFKYPESASQESLDSVEKRILQKEIRISDMQRAQTEQKKHIIWSDTLQLNKLFRPNTIQKENKQQPTIGFLPCRLTLRSLNF